MSNELCKITIIYYPIIYYGRVYWPLHTPARSTSPFLQEHQSWLNNGIPSSKFPVHSSGLIETTTFFFFYNFLNLNFLKLAKPLSQLHWPGSHDGSEYSSLHIFVGDDGTNSWNIIGYLKNFRIMTTLSHVKPILSPIANLSFEKWPNSNGIAAQKSFTRMWLKYSIFLEKKLHPSSMCTHVPSSQTAIIISSSFTAKHLQVEKSNQ